MYYLNHLHQIEINVGFYRIDLDCVLIAIKRKYAEGRKFVSEEGMQSGSDQKAFLVCYFIV